MTNLLAVLPDFDLQPYSRILPSLEKALVSTADLLTLDAIDVAKRANVPPREVKALVDALLVRLEGSLGFDSDLVQGAGAENDGSSFGSPASISTLDDGLDAALKGGISCGCLTEIVGESAVGKTQFLLTLLLSVQLAPPSGCGKGALYISTEAPLQTTRLHQILQSHHKLASLPASEKPSLSQIQSTHIHDVEAQEHILRYQVPVAIRKQNIGLLVIDSIAANYRAEFDKGPSSSSSRGAQSFAQRSAQVAQLGTLLRQLAQTFNIAVVVANQVADRFTTVEQSSSQSLHGSQLTQQSRPVSPARQPSRNLPATAAAQEQAIPAAEVSGRQLLLSTDDPLALDHQQRFFTGWGDDPLVSNLKTPSLGLAWTNQLTARIALLKEPIYAARAYEVGEEREVVGWRRDVKVVFSNWCAEGVTPFEIWEGGVRSVTPEEATAS